MFWYLFVFAAVLLTVDALLKNRKDYRDFRSLPGLRPWPIIGSTLFIVGNSIELFYKARLVANSFRNKGNVCATVGFAIKIINLYDPDDVEKVLSSPKHIRKSIMYRFLHSWLQNGLLTSRGEKWQRRRKILTPTFHFNILRQFYKVFVEHGDNLVQWINQEVGKEETDIMPLIFKYTLNSVCETAMGTNMEENTVAVNRYKKAIHDMGEVLVYRFCRIWMHPRAINKYTENGKEEKRLLKILHEFTTDVIRERRKTRNQEGCRLEMNDSEQCPGIKKRMAMLDLLLKAESEGQIDEVGIREEVDTFMFEGHDTVTMGSIFLLMLLANNPESQDKILEEINEIQPEKDIRLTIEDMNKMNYTEMCIKESLRLYPSVPFIARHLTEDVVLRNTTLVAGTEVWIHPFDIHRNPNLYPDPDKFIPERFSQENSRDRHPYAYIPFSAGPRNCIGQKFAMLEMKSILVAVLRNFKMEAVTRPEDLTFMCDLVLRTKNKIRVKFIPRN